MLLDSEQIGGQMERKTVGWVAHSTRGMIDCHISLTQDLCRTYGIKISDAVCMGISDTYDFDVWIEKHGKVPCLAILGRNPSTEGLIYEKLNFDFTEKKTVDKVQFAHEVAQCIDEGVCVLACVDRYYLPYLVRKFPVSHFGQHWVLIFAIKRVKSVLYFGVYDVFFRVPIWISEDDMHRARSSDWQPYPPDSKYFVPRKRDGWKKPQKEEIAELIHTSARHTAHRMLSSEESGVNGMLIAADELTAFTEKMANDPKFMKLLKYQYYMLQSMVGKFEPTHSMYRITYAKFLRDSKKKYGIFTESQCKQMEEIGQKWSKLYQTMLKSEATEGINHFIQQLRIIADDEKRLFSDIYDYLT